MLLTSSQCLKQFNLNKAFILMVFSLRFSTILTKKSSVMEPHNVKHPYDIPLPIVMHRVLDEEYIRKFDEILIIGDIHGCYDELMMMLTKEDALKSSTLKICVGDLVNKGPKSHQVVKLLSRMDSTLSVRGNHDELVLREYFNALNPFYRVHPRDQWIATLSFDDIMYLSSLPYTISIPYLNSVIVHAGLIPGIPLQGMHPMDLVTMRKLVIDQCSIDETNTSKVWVEPWVSLWCGPEHVYFGHEARLNIQLYPFATGLDTGCVYGNKLSGYFITGTRKGTTIHQNAFKAYAN